MREKKFGKRFLAWVLVLMMTLSLLPVSAMAEDGEARFYGKNVTSTYARDNASVNEAEKTVRAMMRQVRCLKRSLPMQQKLEM